MLQVLLESGAHVGERRARWTAASALAHVALVAFAVALTARDGPPAIERVPLKALVFVVPSVAPRQEQLGETERVGPVAQLLREVPRIAMPSILTPDPLSAIERQGLLESLGAESGIMTTDAGAPQGAGGVFTAEVVDRVVVPRADNAQPDYPSALRASAAQGEVLVRFVVDGTGRVERSSIAIIRSTHALFGDAVRRWLHRTRYFPAEVQGRPVRQLVEQRVEFTLRP